MKHFIILASLLALTGCATPKTWHKDRTPTFNMNNTLAKCRYDVGVAKIHRDERDGMVYDCMVSKGYRYY